MGAPFRVASKTSFYNKNLARLLGTSSFNPSKVCIPIHVSRFIFPRFLFCGYKSLSRKHGKAWILKPEKPEFFFLKEMNLHQSFMTLGKLNLRLQGLLFCMGFGLPLPKKINHSRTPPKFNMEPENKSLEKESPFGNHDLQVPC